MGKLIADIILHLVQGIIVGVGAILPGISGGVLCVAFGIYEPMMELFTHPIQTLKKQYKLFIPFGVGCAVGFVLLAKAVEVFFEKCPTTALMLFFGLICGTIPGIIKSSENSDKKASWTPFVITLALAYLFFNVLENSGRATLTPSFLNYVFSGALWGLSLIIPGLSSSTVLIFLGLYEPLTAGIGTLDFSVILPFLVGIGAVVLLFSRLISMLFKNRYALISRIILGFMIASALKIVPTSFESILVLLISLLCFALGFFISFLMDNQKNKNEKLE